MKPETQKKIDDLLAVLDLTEADQYQWCYEHIPEFRNLNLSLADLAFSVLRDEFLEKGNHLHWIIAALIAKELTE